jgi:DNA-binding GntR family transcriptional regulator
MRLRQSSAKPRETRGGPGLVAGPSRSVFSDRHDGMPRYDPVAADERCPENLDEQVFQRIRGMIAAHELLPGERIVPERIARFLGVSRTPVVNALKRLGQERVVEWVSRRGVFVRRFSRQEMAQLFEVREVLEGLAARLAAPRFPEAEIARFRQVFGQLESDGGAAAARRYLAWDQEFHNRIIEIADSPPLVGATFFLVSTFAHGLIRSIEVGLREHMEILDSFERRDPRAAEDLMRQHIHRSVTWLMDEDAAFEFVGASDPWRSLR